MLFQSTHPRGVRLVLSVASSVLLTFQSTHPRGVRRMVILCKSSGKLFQSTHPRGVRHTFAIYLYLFFCFNPRTHEGCDQKFSLHFFRSQKFQSTHPRGVRPRLLTSIRFHNLFQSTHPRGVRPADTAVSGSGDGVSIHAPTRGATAYSAKYRILIYKSSHFANINQTITFKVIKSLEFL